MRYVAILAVFLVMPVGSVFAEKVDSSETYLLYRVPGLGSHLKRTDQAIKSFSQKILSTSNKQSLPGKEAVIVTATKIQQPLSRTSKAASVITAEDLDKAKSGFVLDALRTVPGVHVRKHGAIGRLTQVSIRGASPNQTLILVDGVEFNSPTTGDADIANLTTDAIQRIEVVRGGESVLYGADAVGGVVNFITRKGEGAPQFKAFGEFGTLRTFREGFETSGSYKNFGWTASISKTDSDGRGEGDQYEALRLKSRLNLDVTDILELEFIFHFLDSRVGIDDGVFGTTSPNVGQARLDPNRFSEDNFFILKPTIYLDPFEWWHQELTFSLLQADLLSADPLDPGETGTPSFFRLDTSSYETEWRHDFYIGEWNVLTSGFEIEDKEADNRTLSKTIFTWAWYIQDQIRLWERLFLTGGVRLLHHNSFGLEAVPQVSLAYFFTKTATKIMANYSQSFRAPTINELYFPGFGNEALQPEKGNHYDVGIEQRLWKDCVHLGFSFFHNEFEDLIQTVVDPSAPFGFSPQNVGEAQTRGFELSAKAILPWGVEVEGSWTYLDTKDEATDKPLVRRPDHIGSVSVHWRPVWKFWDKFSFHFTGLFVGDQDRFTTSSTIKNSQYNKLDLVVTYDLSPHWQIYGKVENFTDDKRPPIKGFPRPGALFVIGTKMEYT